MVERSISMREVRGSMLRISRAYVNIFRFLQKNYCILKPYSKREMKALHLEIFRLTLIVFRFLQKNYCTSFDKQTYCEKKLIIADWPKYLRDSFTQRGESPNGRWLALLAGDSEMKTLHLRNLRPCIIVACFLKKNYFILKLLIRSRLSAKNNLIVAD